MTRTTTAILAALLAASASASISRDRLEALFYDHLAKHNISIKDGTSFVHRLEVFAENLKTIEAHNAKKDKTFTMGLNQFSHLTWEEFKKEVGLTPMPKETLRSRSPKIHGEPSSMVDVPDSIDWTSKGAVTPVKNQAQCGSCWSFSATGALEGAYYLKKGSMPSTHGFSEQNLVSCDKKDNGCNGGWMDNAFAFAKSNGGLATEESYPYVSGNGKVPACDSSNKPVSGSAPSSYTDVQPGSVSAMMSAVAQQPVAIAIQADQSAFQHYSGGVLTSGCGQKLDHGVLNVGYGTENGDDYWLVKNSWGASWGDQGFIKIGRGSSNLCGVLSKGSYPNF